MQVDRAWAFRHWREVCSCPGISRKGRQCSVRTGSDYVGDARQSSGPEDAWWLEASLICSIARHVKGKIDMNANGVGQTLAEVD